MNFCIKTWSLPALRICDVSVTCNRQCDGMTFSTISPSMSTNCVGLELEHDRSMTAEEGILSSAEERCVVFPAETEDRSTNVLPEMQVFRYHFLLRVGTTPTVCCNWLSLHEENRRALSHSLW
jgi:hypothetical protein